MMEGTVCPSLDKWPTRDLKAALRRLGASVAGCVERGDFADALFAASVPQLWFALGKPTPSEQKEDEGLKAKLLNELLEDMRVKAQKPPEPQSPEKNETLETGTVVRLFNLQSAPALNMQKAVVQGRDPATGRYEVRLDWDGSIKKVRFENLQVEEDQPAKANVGTPSTKMGSGEANGETPSTKAGSSTPASPERAPPSFMAGSNAHGTPEHAPPSTMAGSSTLASPERVPSSFMPGSNAHGTPEHAPPSIKTGSSTLASPERAPSSFKPGSNANGSPEHAPPSTKAGSSAFRSPERAPPNNKPGINTLGSPERAHEAPKSPGSWLSEKLEAIEEQISRDSPAQSSLELPSGSGHTPIPKQDTVETVEKPQPLPPVQVEISEMPTAEKPYDGEAQSTSGDVPVCKDADRKDQDCKDAGSEEAEDIFDACFADRRISLGEADMGLPDVKAGEESCVASVTGAVSEQGMADMDVADQNSTDCGASVMSEEPLDLSVTANAIHPGDAEDGEPQVNQVLVLPVNAPKRTNMEEVPIPSIVPSATPKTKATKLKLGNFGRHIRVPGRLSEGLRDLWRSGELCDLTIACRENTFRVHSLVFACHSRQLQEFVRGQTEVQFPDVTFLETVQLFLEFLYEAEGEKGYSPTSAAVNLEVLQLAHRFDLRPLKRQAVIFMAQCITTHNVVQVLGDCEKFALEDLKEKILCHLAVNKKVLAEISNGSGMSEHPELLREILRRVASDSPRAKRVKLS